MLQQILRDMWVDPEILAGLDEEQKQTLFCKMREEQLRRWKIWDKDIGESVRREADGNKSKKKTVSFLHGTDGEPWVWVMGEHENDKSVEDILKEEAIEKARRLAEEETVVLRRNMETQFLSDYMELRSQNNLKDNVQNDGDNNYYCSVDEEQEKSKKVKEKMSHWETGLREERTSEIYQTIQRERMEVEKEAEEAEKEQQVYWQEQEKKAKEAEAEIRKRAKMAREEYKRTSSIFESVEIPGDITSSVPPNKEAVVQWYINTEYKKNAGLKEDVGNFQPWFHGFITRNEAEKRLNEQTEGTFLVRLSERIWGYALSYKTVDKCKHYLISAKEKYRFLGKNHLEHDSLNNLITYHYTHPLTEGEMLINICTRTNDSDTTLIEQLLRNNSIN